MESYWAYRVDGLYYISRCSNGEWLDGGELLGKDLAAHIPRDKVAFQEWKSMVIERLKSLPSPSELEQVRLGIYRLPARGSESGGLSPFSELDVSGEHVHPTEEYFCSEFPPNAMIPEGGEEQFHYTFDFDRNRWSVGRDSYFAAAHFRLDNVPEDWATYLDHDEAGLTCLSSSTPLEHRAELWPEPKKLTHEVRAIYDAASHAKFDIPERFGYDSEVTAAAMDELRMKAFLRFCSVQQLYNPEFAYPFRLHRFQRAYSNGNIESSLMLLDIFSCSLDYCVQRIMWMDSITATYYLSEMQEIVEPIRRMQRSSPAYRKIRTLPPSIRLKPSKDPDFAQSGWLNHALDVFYVLVGHLTIPENRQWGIAAAIKLVEERVDVFPPLLTGRASYKGILCSLLHVVIVEVEATPDKDKVQAYEAAKLVWYQTRHELREAGTPWSLKDEPFPPLPAPVLHVRRTDPISLITDPFMRTFDPAGARALRYAFLPPSLTTVSSSSRFQVHSHGNSDRISRLPYEIQLEIFSWLRGLYDLESSTQVSRSWRALVFPLYSAPKYTYRPIQRLVGRHANGRVFAFLSHHDVSIRTGPQWHRVKYRSRSILLFSPGMANHAFWTDALPEDALDVLYRNCHYVRTHDGGGLLQGFEISEKVYYSSVRAILDGPLTDGWCEDPQEEAAVPTRGEPALEITEAEEIQCFYDGRPPLRRPRRKRLL